MIFSVAESIGYISQYMTLKPGDVISTGTPEGVVLGMTEKNWLKPGDEVTMEVEDVGESKLQIGISRSCELSNPQLPGCLEKCRWVDAVSLELHAPAFHH
jgi:hypothetical protein